MRTARSLCRIALVAVLASLVGCGDDCDCCSNGGAVAAGACALSQPLASLAERVAQTQLSNGAWDYQHLWYDPINYASPGLQNVTGITALGLIDAYRLDLADDGVAECTWFAPAALTRTKDYLVQWMADYVAQTPNPSIEEPGFLTGQIPTNVSFPNFIFCKHYETVFGLAPAELQTVNDAFAALLAARDASHGTDPTVVADGAFNRIVANRTAQGLPGIIGWDACFLLRALVLMGSPQADVDWVQDEIKALPNLDVTLQSGVHSVAHVLVTLNGLGDTSMNATLTPLLQSRRNADGSYSDVGGPSDQATAYALMALNALGLTADAAVTRQFLEARIGVDGIVFDPATSLETYEISGEILWSTVPSLFP